MLRHLFPRIRKTGYSFSVKSRQALETPDG